MVTKITIPFMILPPC